jgi:hypothetical protein
VASVAVAQQGYDDAEIAVSPPSPGTTFRSLRLSRPRPSIPELEERLVGMLEVMDLEIEPTPASAWASEALASDDSEGVSIVELLPGVVVTYDPWLDDLAIRNVALLDAGSTQPLDDVPLSVAGNVLDALIDRGIVDRSLANDDAEVSFVRSGIKGPDGSHQQWVDEVRFESNAQINGVRVLDAGVRIGITPAHDVSSLRVTRIDVEELDPVLIEATDADLRDSFAEYIADSTSASLESVNVGERRPVYVLDPSADSAVVEPQYMVRYLTVTNDADDIRAGSRSKLVFMSLINPEPLVELQLP